MARTPDQRSKDLDAALASIEKQFGKGSVMKLGDESAVRIPAIPTGALSLDLALGIGGIPRGRVTEIYGPESSGKCLTAGTHVWTDHGLETIEELFARVDQPASCTSRVTDVREHGIRLVNEEARWRRWPRSPTTTASPSGGSSPSPAATWRPPPTTRCGC
jgi:hypothetical protein